jgi:hypothetical protein
MRILLNTVVAASLGVTLVAGCDKSEPQVTTGGPAPAAVSAATALPVGFVLDISPDGAKDLAAVKAAGIKDGDEVIVRGVVGGSEKPFVDNRAVVQIIDPSVTTCDKMPGESCATPWDACCSPDDVKVKSATVQVVDAGGQPLKGTLEGVGGVKPLSEVVVRGKARTEGGKALVIDAIGLYVKQ